MPETWSGMNAHDLPDEPASSNLPVLKTCQESRNIGQLAWTFLVTVDMQCQASHSDHDDRIASTPKPP